MTAGLPFWIPAFAGMTKIEDKNMRGYFGFILLTSLTIFPCLPASALMAPPAKLIDQKVTPSCLAVGTDYLFGLSSSYGQPKQLKPNEIEMPTKWPALAVTNDCDSDITITDIKLIAGGSLDRKPAPTTLFLERKGNENTVIYVGKNGDCRAAHEHAEQAFQANQQRANSYNNSKAVADNPLKKVHPPKQDDVECSSFKIPVGTLLRMVVPWGTTYAIEGMAEKTPKVEISGKMVNPYAISPEVDRKK